MVAFIPVCGLLTVSTIDQCHKKYEFPGRKLSHALTGCCLLFIHANNRLSSG